MPNPGGVVILDDEVNMGRVLSKVLKLQGFEVRVFHDSLAAAKAITENPPAVLVTDLRMPGMTGEEILELIKREALPTEVILMTAYGTVESAMNCVKMGAFDYVTKPFDTAKLVETIRKAADGSAPVQRRAPSSQRVRAPQREASIIGDSEAINKVRASIEKLAPTDSPVLIYGESGVGKELVARSLHNQSHRSQQAFVPINCASIPENLMESEFFGHVKGAFTGANDTKIGLMEAADGGTLFLDEIGELPMGLQAKLLRALQEKEITPVGAIEQKSVDIRVVAATNRRLSQEVEEGRFRQDLYYRLNVLAIKIPALRKRPDDIAPLALEFLREFRGRSGRTQLEIEPRALEALSERSWPGNVRELRNFIERLTVLTPGDRITVEDLRNASVTESGILLPGEESVLNQIETGSRDPAKSIRDFKSARDEFEERFVRDVLQACSGNVTDAAKKCGMSRRSMYEKIEKFGIDLTEFKA